MDRLRAMELFQSVAQTGSFTITANKFGISATSVSRALSDFEHSLKVKLLRRSTRHVDLTEAGEEYARHLDGILSSINEAQNSITAISTAPQGTLRVHSRVMFGVGVLTPLIAGFTRKYPDIRIELILGEAKVDLRREQFDIDFRIAPPEEATLRRRMLFHSERLLVASPDYLARHPAPQSPEQVPAHACLAYLLPGDNFVWRFRLGEAVQELEIQPRQITNNGIVLLELARLGEGIALLDDYTVAEDIAAGRLVHLLPDYRVTNTSFEEGIFATILDTPMVPAKIRLFLDFVAEHVAGGNRRFDNFYARQL
ncbi:LysR family transcriptional regulator [Seohaeicola zhoushanensis]|uniref:Transcriptional regulator n=1 Tax=Seohaeicola zhoushanensis TaxID=1569283 RepID=A0A8J3M5Y2_9RHOB|nr:LysR family transcriptional regulator [Seohaeicola zhoushanensis]GHF45051.1 transcriptional regulator [Seohaeicola zhoushanensis]